MNSESKNESRSTSLIQSVTDHQLIKTQIYRNILQGPSDKYENFGAFVRGEREALGRTQAEFADACDLSVGYLNSIESMQVKPPSDKVLVKIGMAMGLEDLDEIFIAAGRLPFDLRMDLRRLVTFARCYERMITESRAIFDYTNRRRKEVRLTS